jgi:hypothetical protein
MSSSLHWTARAPWPGAGSIVSREPFRDDALEPRQRTPRQQNSRVVLARLHLADARVDVPRIERISRSGRSGELGRAPRLLVPAITLGEPGERGAIRATRRRERPPRPRRPPPAASSVGRPSTRPRRRSLPRGAHVEPAEQPLAPISGSGTQSCDRSPAVESTRVDSATSDARQREHGHELGRARASADARLPSVIGSGGALRVCRTEIPKRSHRHPRSRRLRLRPHVRERTVGSCRSF